MSDFGFIGSSYEDSSPNADTQRSVNLYLESAENPNSKGRARLIGTPGLVAFGAALPSSPVRGICAVGSRLNGAPRLFVVAGSWLYEVSSTGAVLPPAGGVFPNGAYGNVGTDASNTPAQMFVNGGQLMIVSAGLVYVDIGGALGLAQPQFTAGSGHVSTSGINVTWVDGDQFNQTMVGNFILIGPAGGATTYRVAAVQDAQNLTLTTDAGLRTDNAFTTQIPVGGVTGGFLDGYFIAQVPNSKQFNISNLNDGLTWSGLDFAVKESDPYNIGRVLTDHEDLWLLGEEQSEVWKNTGNPQFPFERQATIAQGIAACWSAVAIANRVAWIGSDTRSGPVAYSAQGYQPTRISTHAVEKAWRSYARIDDAVAFPYVDEGHSFWFIGFPTANATWVYDFTEGQWHERGFWNGTANVRHLANAHAYQFGAHIVGDYGSGQLFKMTLDAYTDNGVAIHRERTAPHVALENKWETYNSLTLDMEPGGNASITLEISRDAGHTYGTVHTLTTGANFLSRVVFRRLGRARDFVARVRTSAASRIVFVGAYLKTGTTTGM